MTFAPDSFGTGSALDLRGGNGSICASCCCVVLSSGVGPKIPEVSASSSSKAPSARLGVVFLLLLVECLKSLLPPDIARLCHGVWVSADNGRARSGGLFLLPIEGAVWGRTANACAEPSASNVASGPRYEVEMTSFNLLRTSSRPDSFFAASHACPAVCVV